MNRRRLGAMLSGAAQAMPSGTGYQQHTRSEDQQTRIEDLLRQLSIGQPIPTQELAGPYSRIMRRPMTPRTVRGVNPTRTGSY
jgi:hypothetical protein